MKKWLFVTTSSNAETYGCSSGNKVGGGYGVGSAHYVAPDEVPDGDGSGTDIMDHGDGWGDGRHPSHGRYAMLWEIPEVSPP